MSFEVTDEQLKDHFRTALADAEALVKATSDLGGENLNAVRARAEASLRLVQARMDQAQAAVRVKARAAADAGDSYVRENPWEAIGIAASVGVVIGVLVARR